MNKKTQFIATFLILLVLHIPFYVTSVHAAINSVSVRGTARIEGYARTRDTLEFTAKVSLPGSSSILPSQVVLGSGTPFDRCQATSSNESVCTLIYGNNSAFEPGLFAYTINLFRSDGTRDSSLTGNIIIDGNSPTASLVFPATAFSTRNPVSASVHAEDTSCSAQVCLSKCVGISRVEISVVNGTFKRTIDFSNNTNICSADANFSVDVSQLANGPVVFNIIAFDRFGLSSSNFSTTINVDKTPPVVNVNSFVILRNGIAVDGISPRDVTVEVYVNISGSDLDVSSVVADLSLLNPNAAYHSIKPNECQKINDNLHRCRWSITLNSGTDIPDENEITGNAVEQAAPRGSIIINASDVLGNKASVAIPKNLPLDAKGPEVVSLITPYLLEDQFYARPSGNTITATFTESTAMAASDVKLHADGNTVTAQRCRKAGNWICIFENVALSAGKMSIGSDTTDILLNPVRNEKTIEAIVDGTAPLEKGISIRSVNNLDNPELFKVGDKISIEANVTEKNQLFAQADFSKFIKNAKNVKGDCTRKDPDNWVCRWITEPIEFQISNSISFNFSDPAGNADLESRQLTTLGLDTAAPPDYWTNSYSCSPSALDRQLGPFINQRMFCSVTLTPKQSGAQTVSISQARCASNAVLQSVDTINRQPGSENPIVKLTFKKDSFNTNEIKLDCSFEVFTRTGDKITKNPEVEKLNLTVKFYNQPLGELSEEVEKKIEDAKKDAQGIWKLIGTLNKLVAYAKKICQIINTIYTVLAVFYSLTMLLKALGLPTFGLTEGPAQATCHGTEGISKSADGIKGRLNQFCDFVTCKQTLWGDDIEGWINSLPGADFIGEDGSGLVYDYNLQKWVNQGPKARPLSAYMDPQNSLFVASLYGCLPGIIHGLDKYRQIKCLYADCLINSVGQDGMPLKVCEDQKKYATCKYVWGEIFALVPYTAMFDHYMGLIKDALSNPFKGLGVGVSVFCQHFCKTPDGGFAYGFCRGARLFALVGDAAENIQNIVDTGFEIREDYCSRLDFDEEEPDEEETEDTDTKK